MTQKQGRLVETLGAAVSYMIILIGGLHMGASTVVFIRRWGYAFDWKVYEAAAHLGATTDAAYMTVKGYHFVYPPIVLHLFALLAPALPLVLVAIYIACGAALLTERMKPLTRGLLVFAGLTPFSESRLAAAIAFANIALFMHVLIAFIWLSVVRKRSQMPFWLAVGGSSLIKPYFLAYLIVPFIVNGTSAAAFKRSLQVIAGVGTIWVFQFVFWRSQFDAFLRTLRAQGFGGAPDDWLKNMGHGFLYYFARLTGNFYSALALHVLLSAALVLAAFVMGCVWRRRGMKAEFISLVALAIAIIVNPRLKSYDDSVYCGLLAAFLLFAIPASNRALRNRLAVLFAGALAAMALIAGHALQKTWSFDTQVALNTFAPLVVLVLLELRQLFMTRDDLPPRDLPPEPQRGRCQTDENASLQEQDNCPLFSAKSAPLGESGSAVGLEILSAVEAAFRVEEVVDCPSSDDLGHEGLIENGGAGSLGFQSMPRAVDAASGAYRWSWL